jgi:hypothetical protein
MKSLTKHQFIDAFSNEIGDIAIRFESISTWLTIPWRDIIHASQSIMLFGDPISQGCLFTSLFWKMKPQHLHHILRQFASEYFGDSRACSMLFIEYRQARLDAAVAELQSLNKASALSNLFQQSLFNSDEVQQFQYWFDWYCQYAFINCMNQYNDYSQPLILADDFMNFLNLSKKIFPQQWDFLAVTHGIQMRDGDELQEYKEWQIFMVMLNLQRLANFRTLKHWAMVISTAYYGWGGKITVGNVTSFLGISVSRRTRDAFFKQLTLDRVQFF